MTVIFLAIFRWLRQSHDRTVDLVQDERMSPSSERENATSQIAGQVINAFDSVLLL